jgi:hypothetical protein
VGLFNRAPVLEHACVGLGLTPAGSTSERRFDGRVTGVAVAVTAVGARPGGGDAVVVARLPRAMDIGLHVRGAPVIPGRMGHRGVGDPRFDGVFVTDVASGDLGALTQVMSRDVKRLLHRLAASGWPTLTDDALVFACVVRGSSPAEVQARIGWCVECARAVSDAAANLEAPHPLVCSGVASALTQAARARRLVVTRNALRAEGAIAGGHLAVEMRSRAAIPLVDFAPERRATGWRGHLRFDEPLGVGLTVHRATLGERLMRAAGARELRSGDADFDRAWTLAACDESLARRMVGPRSRRVLEALAACELAVSLDDAGLSFAGELPESAATVTRALDALDHLRDALRPSLAVSPYR